MTEKPEKTEGAPPPPSQHVTGECQECQGTGEIYGHADDCSDDLCALNGDIHSCCGKVEPCACIAAPADLTNEQKEITLLRIIDAMGGQTDSSESKWNWIHWFCSDEIHNVQEDTFNRCHDKGWLHSTHNSDFDTSTTTLTDAGRAALSSTTEGSDR